MGSPADCRQEPNSAELTDKMSRELSLAVAVADAVAVYPRGEVRGVRGAQPTHKQCPDMTRIPTSTM